MRVEVEDDDDWEFTVRVSGARPFTHSVFINVTMERVPWTYHILYDEYDEYEECVLYFDKGFAEVDWRIY